MEAHHKQLQNSLAQVERRVNDLALCDALQEQVSAVFSLAAAIAGGVQGTVSEAAARCRRLGLSELCDIKANQVTARDFPALSTRKVSRRLDQSLELPRA